MRSLEDPHHQSNLDLFVRNWEQDSEQPRRIRKVILCHLGEERTFGEAEELSGHSDRFLGE
jgi:hypothetical protein